MNQTEKQMRKWYLDERKTTYEIAELMKCSQATVGRMLRRFGIESRKPTECHNKAPEIVSCAKCGTEFEVGGRGRPKKYSRYCSHRCHMHDKFKHYEETLRSKEWLTQKYVTERLSLSEIGAILKCQSTSVKRALADAGIPIRSMSEGRTVLFDRRGRKHVPQTEVIEAYGGVCACCGETEPEFLTIDHIGGGGNKHRKSFGGNGVQNLRRHLKAQGWPKDKYRLLCMNCNHATRHGKTCPHQLKKESDELWAPLASAARPAAVYTPPTTPPKVSTHTPVRCAVRV